MRPIDPRLRSNQIILAVVAISLVTSLVIWMNGGPLEVWWAAPQAFVLWALVRELDPDHNWTAIVAAVATAVWVVAGYPMVSLFAGIALVVAARLVLNSPGRRPLTSDLIVLGIYAAAISFTGVGWVAGFGLAIAIYIDERMSPEHRPIAIAVSGFAALGASIVANASDTFPPELTEIYPLILIGIGLLALVTILRIPPHPVSPVDSPMRYFLDPDRLHAARSLVAVLLFATAALLGPDIEAVAPLALAILLSLVSAEGERLRRRPGSASG